MEKILYLVGGISIAALMHIVYTYALEIKREMEEEGYSEGEKWLTLDKVVGRLAFVKTGVKETNYVTLIRFLYDKNYTRKSKYKGLSLVEVGDTFLKSRFFYEDPDEEWQTGEPETGAFYEVVEIDLHNKKFKVKRLNWHNYGIWHEELNAEQEKIWQNVRYQYDQNVEI